MKNIISIFTNTAIVGALIVLGLIYFGMGMFYGMQVVLMAVVPAMTFVFIFEVLNYVKENSNNTVVVKAGELSSDALQRITKEYEEKSKTPSTDAAKFAEKSAKNAASKAKVAERNAKSAKSAQRKS